MRKLRLEVVAGVLALALLAISTLNGIEIDVGGFTVTPERAASPALLIATFVIVLLRRSYRLPESTAVCLAAWLFVALVSSIASPVMAWSLRMWVVLAIATSYYWMLVFVRADLVGIFSSRMFFLICVLFGPVFSLILLTHYLGVQQPAWVSSAVQVGGGVRLKGSMTEANILGAFIPLLIFGVYARNKPRNYAWFAVLIGLMVSLVLSFSRIPWVAFVVSIPIYALLTNNRSYTTRSVSKVVLVGATLSIVAAVAAFFGYLALSQYEEVGRTSSITTRFVMWGLAWEGVIDRPVLGSGVFSFSEMHPYAPRWVGSETHRSAWISNLSLGVLHDTGLLGFVLFTSFLVLLIKRGWFAARAYSLRGMRGESRALAASVASSIALIVSSQSIPSYSLAFFWICLAFVEIGARGERA